MSSKIFFTDLDNTLLDEEKRISEANRRAVARALEEGHRIVINTGRPLMGITSQIEALGLDAEGCYAVAYNGGLIYDCCRREVIFRHAIPLPDVCHIFRQAEKLGLFCQAYDSRQVIAPRDTPELREYVRRIQVPWKVDPNCPESLVEEPVKVLVIGDEQRIKTEAYRKSIEEWARGRISVFYSSQSYLDHAAYGVSKGSAVRQLCRILNIPLENTVAAGDAENDIPMIQAARIGVAVANAAESVKAAAGYVTENDCNHSAAAEIIEKFILE